MIESTAVENTLKAAEITRGARDLAITGAIGICVIPVLYIANLIMLRGNGAVLITGYTIETAVIFILSLLLMWRLVTTSVKLNRLLKNQEFLCKEGPTGSAYVYFLRRLVGIDS